MPGDPATLDYYTDEALIALLLGINSRTHPLPASAWQALIAVPDAGGLIRTWPGSLFTYQFLHAFVDTRALSRCETVNWCANSALAIRRTIAHAENNPRGFATYGANAWGLSAAKGPYDAYHAYAAPPAAVANPPEEDGTVTYYSMISSLTFGADLRQRAIAAANAGWARAHWHPRFGLPDTFNDQVAQVTLDPAAKAAALRKNGPWVQRALFAIDQGPMLLHLENARSGLIWQLDSAQSQSCWFPAAVVPCPLPAVDHCDRRHGVRHSHTPTDGYGNTDADTVNTWTWTPTNTPTPTTTATPPSTPSPTSTRTATNTPTPTLHPPHRWQKSCWKPKMEQGMASPCRAPMPADWLRNCCMSERQSR